MCARNRINIISNFKEYFMIEQEKRIEALEMQVQEMKLVEQQKYLSSRALELGIPQSRIDEGFALTGSESEEETESYLKKIAQNYKQQSVVNATDIKKAAESLAKGRR